jgi:hypothetical protein
MDPQADLMKRARRPITFVTAALLAACSSEQPAAHPDAGPDVVARRCTPGATSCGDDGLSPRTCDAAGQAWVPAARCDGPGGEVCDEGRCARACEESATRRETRGCEFWPVETLHPELGRLSDGQSPSDFPFTVVVSNPWPSPVHVTLEGGALGAPVDRDIAAGATTSMEVPWQPALVDGVDYLHRASVVARAAALHLQASAPVSAYQFNPLKFIRSPDCEGGGACYSFTGDASLLLPAASLGREHVIVAWPTQRSLARDHTEWSVGAGFLSVVGTRPDTRVTVQLAGGISAGDGIPAASAGDRRSFVLGAGDVLQLLSSTDPRCVRDTLDRQTDTRFCLPVATEDLTGTIVTASAPVAVFAGHECAQVPFDRYACDHLEEQIPPVDTLGVRYVISRSAPYPPPVPLHPEGEPTVVRIVATHDGTDVTFEPATAHAPARLDRGESLTIESRDEYAVVGSSPLLVATFLVGADYLQRESSSTIYSVGDPAMSIETPVEQYRSRYDFFVPPAFVPSYANVVIARGGRLILDGVPVTAAPTSSLGARDIYRLSLIYGPHRIEGETAATRFGLRVYGFTRYTSFMFPGGGDLTAIAPPL